MASTMTFTPKRAAALLFLTALFITSVVAQAASSARIVETYPSDRSSLGSGESFWVRIAYTSDEPISLWVRPYRRGVPIKQILSNASMSYAGSGEALGWFSLIDAGDVDEIHVIAGGGKPFHEWELSRDFVDLRWSAAPSSGEARPQWVEDLLAVEVTRYREDAQRRAAEPVSAGEWTLFNGFMLTMLVLLLAGIAVPIRAVWKWRGGWRIAAAIPVAVMGFIILRILVDTARDPTSHNLWPFEILTFGTVTLVCIGALKLGRKFMHVED